MTDKKEPVYVIFDGPPSEPAPRFVETETEDGLSFGGGGLDWEQLPNGLWRLGPFHLVDQESSSISDTRTQIENSLAQRVSHRSHLYDDHEIKEVNIVTDDVDLVARMIDTLETNEPQKDMTPFKIPGSET